MFCWKKTAPIYKKIIIRLDRNQTKKHISGFNQNNNYELNFLIIDSIQMNDFLKNYLNKYRYDPINNLYHKKELDNSYELISSQFVINENSIFYIIE